MKEVKVKELSIADEARAEVNAEIRKDAVKKLKNKMRQLVDAETIVSNIKREIEDLEAAAEQGNI